MSVIRDMLENAFAGLLFVAAVSLLLWLTQRLSALFGLILTMGEEVVLRC